MLGAQGAGVDFTELPLPALGAEDVKLAQATLIPALAVSCGRRADVVLTSG